MREVRPVGMKIRVWWLNRVFLYWIPVIFVYDLLSTLARHGISAAVTNIVIAMLITIFFEQYLFGYKIDLSETTIKYTEGFLSRKNISIEREDVASAYFLETPILIKMKSIRLAITTHEDKRYVVSLAAFKPSDIKRLVDWLPAKKI